MPSASRQTPKQLGNKLLQIRHTLHLTQKEMLHHLSLPKPYARHYISGFETGAREPSLLVLLQYSKIAEVWINTLVDDNLKLPKRLPAKWKK
jgi:transcriptional regulator with XRE-family HTH domain